MKKNKPYFNRLKIKILPLIIYFCSMKIKYFYLLITAVCFSSCYNPERKCADFKTGEFTFDYEINGEEKTGRFTRDKEFSVEYYENKIDSSSVRWINDCEFVLKSLNDQSSIHFKILETTKESYTFEYSNAVRDPKKELIVKRGTATRVK
ncbi:hypothetical protein SAMN05660313_00619 [Cellulophaga fucicola]|uniref:DNA topoisomerase IV n=2 Tax=Cellulophaga fucicola TaxID=76595 RepID=A0A1K1MH16_9FLAO|nr:hypothetical protein SAMN05660313_00619 [Cellulophaga fucicola]